MAVRMPLDAFGADDGDEVNEQAVKFQELWQHRAALHDLCKRIVGDAATADDVVQETYMRALRNLDRLERRPSLMPWLATVARRRSIDELRRRRYQTPVDTAPDDSTKPEWDPGESVAASETVERVREALTTLTPRERDLLVRQVNHGLSLAELATEDESTIASVRSVLSRARTKLRTALIDAGMQVLAPLFLVGGWLKRKVGPAASRVHHAVAAPAAYERAAETLVAGVAAAGLTLGGLPALTGDNSTDPVAAPEVAVVAQDAGISSPAAGGGSNDDDPSPAGVVTASPVAPTETDESSDPGTRTAALSVTPAEKASIADQKTERATRPAKRERSVPKPERKPPLAPTAASVPEDTEVYDFGAGTAGDDGTSTVFALGRTCGDDSCSILWKSIDGGASWSRVKADGLRAHTLMVPPTWDDGDDLYAVGSTGVQVSTDGGNHFQTVLGPSYDGPAAMSPGFSREGAGEHIYLGAAPNWRFDARTRMATPLAMGLSGNEARFAFDPDFPSTQRMYAATRSLETGLPVLYVCTGGWCPASDTVKFPDLAGATPHVAVSSSDPSVIFVWGRNLLYRSTDRGTTFDAVQLPVDAPVTGFADDTGGTLFLSLADSATRAGGVARSTDGGETWRLVGADTRLASGAAEVSTAPGGVILAAPRTDAGGGVLCSTNAGASWADRC